MKNVSIIIPAFNEEKTIKKLLNKILSIDLSNINFAKMLYMRMNEPVPSRLTCVL